MLAICLKEVSERKWPPGRPFSTKLFTVSGLHSRLALPSVDHVPTPASWMISAPAFISKKSRSCRHQSLPACKRDGALIQREFRIKTL